MHGRIVIRINVLSEDICRHKDVVLWSGWHDGIGASGLAVIRVQSVEGDDKGRTFVSPSWLAADALQAGTDDFFDVS